MQKRSLENKPDRKTKEIKRSTAHRISAIEYIKQVSKSLPDSESKYLLEKAIKEVKKI